jgi:hypothetical protein
LRSFFQFSNAAKLRDRDGFALSTWEGHSKFDEIVSHLTVHSFALHGINTKAYLKRFCKHSSNININIFSPHNWMMGKETSANFRVKLPWFQP